MADVRQVLAAVIISIICKKRKSKRKAKEVWGREWLRRVTERGVYRQLLVELRLVYPVKGLTDTSIRWAPP